MKSVIIPWDEYQKEIKELKEKVEKLEAAIEYSRQHYHLPQMVLDLFRALVPSYVLPD